MRIALGATRANIVQLRVVQGARPVGLVMGVVVAYFSTRALSGLLFDTSPTDLATFVRMTLILVAVTIAACAWPARRAASVDPTEVLRQE